MSQEDAEHVTAKPTGSVLRRWGDEQQFYAEPMQTGRDQDGNIIPRVDLLWMTPDPLGACAAMARMYKGIPTYSLQDITDEERRDYWDDMMRSHLRTPLEAIQLHFHWEGITRAFTHQGVRQRTAAFAQESLRFAVTEDMADRVATPPSIARLAKHHPDRQKWDAHLKATEEFYNFLVMGGYPAEDARYITPHGITTRYNYITDLMNLANHAGNRLCTQANFEWNTVIMGVVKAIREYTPDFSWLPASWDYEDVSAKWEDSFRWQFELIADSVLFKPVCYQMGKCTWKASFDRACTIRDRVDKFEEHGVPSSQWSDPTHDDDFGDGTVSIQDSEWLNDPAAARVATGVSKDA